MSKTKNLLNRFEILFKNKKSINKYAINIENSLDVKLSKEFHSISAYFDGDCLGFGLFCFDRTATIDNVIDRTIEYRRLDPPLPHQFIALGENDVSFFALNTHNDEVTEMSLNDYYNFVENRSLEDNPQVFKSFTDFFAYLLDEEEKMRQEEASHS